MIEQEIRTAFELLHLLAAQLSLANDCAFYIIHDQRVTVFQKDVRGEMTRVNRATGMDDSAFQSQLLARICELHLISLREEKTEIKILEARDALILYRVVVESKALKGSAHRPIEMN